MFTVAFMLAAVPIAVLVELIRWLAKWRRMPLSERNARRAGFGGFGLMLCIAALGLCNSGRLWWLPARVWPVFAAGAGISAFYLAVGLLHQQNARFDFMSVFWWTVGALGSVAALTWWAVLGNG